MSVLLGVHQMDAEEQVIVSIRVQEAVRNRLGFLPRIWLHRPCPVRCVPVVSTSGHPNHPPTRPLLGLNDLPTHYLDSTRSYRLPFQVAPVVTISSPALPGSSSSLLCSERSRTRSAASCVDSQRLDRLRMLPTRLFRLW